MNNFTSFWLRLGVALCLFSCFPPDAVSAQEAPAATAPTTTNTTVDVAAQKHLPGLWRGRLKIDEKNGLSLVFEIERKADNSLQAWMHSLSQNALDLRIINLQAQNNIIKFEVPSVGGVFEGVLQGEGGDDRRLAGTWTQGAPLPLEMQPVASVPEIARPQEPTQPYPYRSEEITFVSGALQIKGTLTVPPADGDKKFPAVVFIQDGAPGQQPSRDARQFAHRPFLVLSDWLTRQGIATLRFDPRSAGNLAMPTPVTYGERISDLQAALKFLRARPEIDGARVGVLSIGEGSNIASGVAASDPTLAFLVLMSPLGLRGAELLTLQATAMPEMKEQAAAQIEVIAEIIDILETEDDDTRRTVQLRATIEKTLKKVVFASARELKPEQQKMLDSIVNAQLQIVGMPWFREFIGHDPREILSRVQTPTLAISGQFNTLIPARENLASIREALQKGGNKDATVQELPGLNYQFQTTQTGKMEEFAKTKETISPKVLELLNDWLQKRLTKPA
ncbi:MAG: uncharacterized protein JWN98_9 [Abditibacteriota bacterium]|nr:uncharacterized protein [Abditibacteriota bacterium]